MKKIVTIGGGSGHAQILKGLRGMRDIAITAVCPTTDSGGSTGRLAQEYGSSGYIGDLTKCIAALSPDRSLARTLMYRFSGGVLNGHSLKNILLLALERTLGAADALAALHRIARIDPHRVVPVATVSAELRAHLKFGTEVRGETNIDLLAHNPLWHPDAHAITDLFLKPRICASSLVTSSVRNADAIVICPGDLYSSILPVLLPEGMKAAITRSSGRIVLVLNIMTKLGETQGYRAEDFITRIEERLGRPCDVILANTGDIPRKSRLMYAVERKVKLASVTLRRDRRVRQLPLVKVAAGGEIVHDERVIARALAEFFR